MMQRAIRGGVWTWEGVDDVREYVRIVEDADDVLEVELEEPGEKVRIVVLYLVREKAKLRYSVVQKAEQVEAGIWMAGVVMNGAQKEAEMRIEFVSGAKGAVGREREEVVLVGEPGRNVSRPEMICGEEEVVGQHGVAVGRVDEEQVRYLMSRGVRKAEARNMLMRAKLVQVVNKIVSEDAKKSAQKWVDGLKLEIV